jgi:hypothetical protein
MRYDEYSLKKLLNDLTSEYTGISEVYLFGSRLHRTRSTKSDVDLLIEVNESVLGEDIRDFALRECPALDFFLLDDGIATSCANGSRVRAKNKKELVRRLGAVKIWDISKGFLAVDVDWEFKVIKGMTPMMTTLVSSTPFPSKADAVAENMPIEVEVAQSTGWDTLSSHPIRIVAGSVTVACAITFTTIYQLRIVPLEREISNLQQELNKHTSNAQKESISTKTSIDRSNLAVVTNGNQNTVNVLKQNSIESFFKKLSIEKEINLPLLDFLSQPLEGNQIQQLALKPEYLSVDVLSQYNQYEIDKTTLKTIMRLKNSLLEINKKIAYLHQANNKMIQGNIQEIQSAVINFAQVSQISNESIALYDTL